MKSKLATKSGAVEKGVISRIAGLADDPLPLQDELDQAVEQRRRAVYLGGLKADYAALQQDPKAIAEFQKEIELWDIASNDGLEKL